MRKWTILIASTIICSAASTAMAAESSTGATSLVMSKGTSAGRTGALHGFHSRTSVRQWGPHFRGRWFAGWHAPGGWRAYRRPVTGYVLPRYWISPRYLIPNYGAYGLPAPATGYRWSRYYDDAVMTDPSGRIIDHRAGVDWDGYETLRDHDDHKRGASYDDGYDDSVTYNPDSTPSHGYEGRWTGTWRDQNGKTFSGDYEGRFEGKVDGYGVDYDAPPSAETPSYRSRTEIPGGEVVTTQGPGYIAGGYYYPAPIVTTVTINRR